MASRSRRTSRPRRLFLGGLSLAPVTLCGVTGAAVSDAGAVAGATVRVTVFNYAALPDVELTVTRRRSSGYWGSPG